MKVPQLTPEVCASLGIEPKPLPSAHNAINRREWMLARIRSMSLGLRLLQAEIDQIGISLKNEWISPEQALADVLAIEQVPVYAASVFYSSAEGAGE